MRGFYEFYLLSRLLGNPILALIILAVIYAIVDRRYVGFVPDFLRPFQRAAALRRLRRTLEVNPADANAHMEMGMLLAEKGRWQEAVEHLEVAKDRIGNSQAYFHLGMAYCSVGRWEEGKAALEKALELNPSVGYGEPYLYLAEYRLRHGQRIDDVPGLEEAMRQFGSVDVCYRLGRLYERAGSPAQARAMYREALETHAGNPPFLRRKHRRTALKAWLRQRLISD